jgi:hypothetical protein
VAVYDLGLTTEQFYALTLLQFLALQQRFIEAEKRNDRRVARLASVIVNMSGKVSKQHFSEDEFMPGGKEPKQQTPQEMIAVLLGSGLKAKRVN